MGFATAEKSKRQFGVTDRWTLFKLGRDYQREIADRLHRFRWDHFITLTYMHGKPAGGHEFADLHDLSFRDVTAFRRKVIGRQLEPFYCYWVVEDTDTPQVAIHLLSTNLRFPLNDLRLYWWRHGFTDAKRIGNTQNDRKKVIDYIVKQAPYSLHPASEKFMKGLPLYQSIRT